jgi:hypothetical protein
MALAGMSYLVGFGECVGVCVGVCLGEVGDVVGLGLDDDGGGAGV